MSRTIRTAGLLSAIVAVGASPLASAWTPYGYGYGYGGDQQGYPYSSQQDPEPAAGGEEPGGFPPPPGFPPYGPSRGGAYPYGPPWSSGGGDAGAGAGAGPSPQTGPFPGYGPPPGYPGAYPGANQRGYTQTSSFRVSRETSDDAYILNIEVQGIEPAQLQVTTQGQRLRIRSELSQQQLQDDSFDEGRGSMRSYSFSTGTASRHLTVPPDGDLSTMRRENGEQSVRIVIPRR